MPGTDIYVSTMYPRRCHDTVRHWEDPMKQISRRAMLGTAATMVTTAAFAEGCPVGPPQHHKGPLVFMDYDQVELDASYDQVYYEPLIARVSQRLDSNSDGTRARIGAPQRAAYGPTEIEKLDIYRTSRPNAPVFVFIHGGNWRVGSAKQYGYPAEMFINAGAHYVALDFIAAKEAGGDLGRWRRRYGEVSRGSTRMPRASVAIRNVSSSGAIPRADI